MICLKICTFVVSKTTKLIVWIIKVLLWFAWKSVPLWYLKQHISEHPLVKVVVICLKICTFVVSKTTTPTKLRREYVLWFAWKSVPLWYLKQLNRKRITQFIVVICLKICTFVVSKTTQNIWRRCISRLWFAWKSVPLWYLKQHLSLLIMTNARCDLLENLYLCGI